MVLNGGQGPRLGLALTGSLMVHAALWWWQPVEPPTVMPGGATLQVSLRSVERDPADESPSPEVPEEHPASTDAVADTEPAEDAAPPRQAEPASTPSAAATTSEAPASVVPEPVESARSEPLEAPSEPAEFEPPAAKPEPRPESRPAATARTEQADPPPTERRPVPRPVAETARAAPRAEAESAASTDATAAAAPEPARILNNPKPAYPRQARRRGLEGQVVLDVEVRADGRPGRIDIVASSGHSILDRAALEGLRQWRFQPARRGGRAVDATLRVPVSFRLN